MKNDIPVVLSKAITELNPAYLWLGGGEVDLKLGMSIDDFMRVKQPLIADTS